MSIYKKVKYFAKFYLFYMKWAFVDFFYNYLSGSPKTNPKSVTATAAADDDDEFFLWYVWPTKGFIFSWDHFVRNSHQR